MIYSRCRASDGQACIVPHPRTLRKARENVKQMVAGSAIENGYRQMGRERALSLAKALHVHPAVLLFPDFDMADVS